MAEHRLGMNGCDGCECGCPHTAHFEREASRLRNENRQLRQRSSPETEPCMCPEFCNYHKRSRFEELRAEKAALHETLLKESALGAEIADVANALREENAALKAQSSADCPTCHEPIYNVRGAIADMDKLRSQNAKLQGALKDAVRVLEGWIKSELAGTQDYNKALDSLKVYKDLL